MKYTFRNLSTLNNPLRYWKLCITTWADIIQLSPLVNTAWEQLPAISPEYQIFCFDEKEQLVGFVNSIPFHYDDDLNKLPDQGWDWMLEKGLSDHKNSINANHLGGLQIAVFPAFRQMGISKIILSHLKKTAKEKGLKDVLVPIRPTKKHLHPEVSMTSYIDKKENNKIFDPWIRTHVNAGGQIIKVCEQSMSLTLPSDKLIKNYNLEITKSGQYPVPGALSLVIVNLETNQASYQEPNIWIKHNVD